VRTTGFNQVMSSQFQRFAAWGVLVKPVAKKAAHSNHGLRLIKTACCLSILPWEFQSAQAGRHHAPLARYTSRQEGLRPPPGGFLLCSDSGHCQEHFFLPPASAQAERARLTSARTQRGAHPFRRRPRLRPCRCYLRTCGETIRPPPWPTQISGPARKQVTTRVPEWTDEGVRRRVEGTKCSSDSSLWRQGPSPHPSGRTPAAFFATPVTRGGPAFIPWTYLASVASQNKRQSKAR